jgi:hypothetical protein
MPLAGSDIRASHRYVAAIIFCGFHQIRDLWQRLEERVVGVGMEMGKGFVGHAQMVRPSITKEDGSHIAVRSTDVASSERHPCPRTGAGFTGPSRPAAELRTAMWLPRRW